LTSTQSTLVAHETAINTTLSTLVADFASFSDVIRNYLSRPPDVLGGLDLSQSPRTRLATTWTELRRLAAEFRRGMSRFGVAEQSVWKRLIADGLTRRFYEALRSDAAGLSAHQLREFVDNSPGGELTAPPSEWTTNDELDSANGDPPSSVEDRYALLNADVPTMDVAAVSDRVTRELSRLADQVDVDGAVKVKVSEGQGRGLVGEVGRCGKQRGITAVRLSTAV